jgi:hypothetical protein
MSGVVYSNAHSHSAENHLRYSFCALSDVEVVASTLFCSVLYGKRIGQARLPVTPLMGHQDPKHHTTNPFVISLLSYL